MKLSKYRYETVAVLDGAAIMTLEIVGARIISPYFGSTVFVWTAVIGVILGALSVGYWYGGRLADRGATDRKLAAIIIMAAVTLLISLTLAPQSLELAAGQFTDVRWQALVASLLLFAPFNFLAGITSPYLAKLKVTDLAKTGSSVGALYAAGTTGSIIGTFITGYWLIGLVGNQAIVLSLVLVLLISSLLISPRGFLLLRAGLAAIVLLNLFSGPPAKPQSVLYQGDSAYAKYQIVDTVYNGMPVRLLTMGNEGAQSGIRLDLPSQPAFDYVARFLEAAEAVKPQRVLIIGGGTYTVPQFLQERYPAAQIDVVEIDPHLDKLAERFFGFEPSRNVNIIHQDGRTFINRDRQQYDLIYIDAYSTLTPAVQLTTVEAVARMKQSLTPEGVVVANLISAIEGDKAEFLEAELATYRAVFDSVSVSPASSGRLVIDRQNIILVAGSADGEVMSTTTGLALPPLTQVANGMILTDDFAPVEHLIQK